MVVTGFFVLRQKNRSWDKRPVNTDVFIFQIWARQSDADVLHQLHITVLRVQLQAAYKVVFSSKDRGIS